MNKTQMESELNKLAAELNLINKANGILKDTNDKLSRENHRLWGLVDRLVETINAGAKEAIWPRRPVP